MRARTAVGSRALELHFKRQAWAFFGFIKKRCFELVAEPSGEQTQP
jgi:hypothetical protein